MITITEIDKMSAEDRIKLMKSWTDSELTNYLCPNGTMPIEDFRKYAYEITEDKSFWKILVLTLS